jgi:hypothetical protein
MIKKFITAKKSKAQALIEFALILTLLLTLLYGILEAGRLMFIYASTVMAARQATRYGSATGNNSSGTPYYKDCAGIRAAAKQLGFLNTFSDTNIVITYDSGPSTANLFASCEALAANSASLDSGDRIKVCVSTTWNPIVGALVPLRWSGAANCSGTVANNTITKRSERTILSSVSIGVTAIPGAWTGSGNLSLAVVASPTTYSTVGQLITYTYTMRNTGAIDLVGPFSLTANNTSTTCGAGTTLYPGQTLVCTGTYRITQEDLDAGVVVSLTVATGGGASSDQIATTITAVQSARLTLAKSASPDSASVPGTIIKYTYLLTNAGNVTLTSPYTVTDNKTSVSCPSTDMLRPGGSVTCTANYPLKQSPDIDDGILINTATATAMKSDTSTTVTSNADSATVYTSKLVLTIITSSTTATYAGQVITYTYKVYNNSGEVVPSPTITDSKFTVNCPSGPIANKEFVICMTADTIPPTYTVTQADIDAGSPLTNTATATAGAFASRTVTASISVVRNDSLYLTISATTSPASTGTPTVTAVGNTFTFNYMLTNTGNTTLTEPYTINPSTIRDGGTAPLHTALAITCGTGDLLPGTSTAANFCYSAATSVTANDLTNVYGSYYITNLATAKARTKVGTRDVTSAQQTGFVATYNGARLALGITADPTNAPSTGTEIEFTYTLTSTGNVPVTLPSPYTIAWAITIGSTAGPTGEVVCASPITTIPVNSSTTCKGKSTYTTTATFGNVINTATAPIAGTNLSTPATGQVTVTRTFLCNVTHSGAVPNTATTGPDKDKTTWSIYNKTGGEIHITSITVIWNTLERSLKNVSLSGTSVWSGSTGTSGFTIDKDTPSSSTKPDWGLSGLTVGIGSQPITLTFSGTTTTIRVVIVFSEPSCISLDSANPAQQGTPP